MYVIRNQIMATFLMGKGFRLIKLDTDKTNPNRNVYLFKDSKELRKAMEMYQKD
jgi:MinD superfamily P-loop ATPase